MENVIIKHGSFTHPLSIKLFCKLLENKGNCSYSFIFLALGAWKVFNVCFYYDPFTVLDCSQTKTASYVSNYKMGKPQPTINRQNLRRKILKKKKKKKRLFRTDIPKSTEEGLPSNHLNNIYTESNYRCWQISQLKSFPSSCKDQTG